MFKLFKFSLSLEDRTDCYGEETVKKFIDEIGRYDHVLVTYKAEDNSIVINHKGGLKDQRVYYLYNANRKNFILEERRFKFNKSLLLENEIDGRLKSGIGNLISFKRKDLILDTDKTQILKDFFKIINR